VVISRRVSVFLMAVGVWTWLIWPRFGLAIWKDDRSFSNGAPTSFLWVHAVLIVASLAIGTAVGVLGVRAWRAAGRSERAAGRSETAAGRSARAAGGSEMAAGRSGRTAGGSEGFAAASPEAPKE
jgi:hypothetical protein